MQRIGEPLNCPLCKQHFSRALELLDHLAEEHPRPKPGVSILKAGSPDARAGQSKSNPDNKPRLVSCPECGQGVGNLPKHLKRVHSPEALAHKKEQQKRKEERKRRKREQQLQGKTNSERMREGIRNLHELRKTRPDAQMCGFCSELFNTNTELQKHLHAIHGLRSNKQVRVQENSRGPASKQIARHPENKGYREGGLRKLSSVNPCAQDMQERRMDATYGMGGTARDHGSFGSASSYDGMDDESSP